MGYLRVRGKASLADEGQEGATAVVVAISLVLLLAVGSFAIDLGSAWATKRGLVADTDAAALAAAPLVLGTCSTDAMTAATAAAADLLEANMGKAPDPTRLDVSLDCNTGAVTVEYVGNAQVTFASVVGFEELRVLSSSTAAGDFLGGGLRPFSVCMLDDDVTAWLAGDGDQDGDTAERNVLRLDYVKSWDNADPANESACGGAPGNWGMVCYDEDYGKGGASSVATDNPCGTDGLVQMILEGYPGLVDLGDGSTPHDCAPDSAGSDDCDTVTGNWGGSLAAALASIQCPADTDAVDCPVQFSILGTSAYTPPAAPSGGSNATLYPTHFVGVVLREFKTNPSRLAFIEFELVNLFTNGTSAVASDSTLQREPPTICDVDHAPSQC